MRKPHFSRYFEDLGLRIPAISKYPANKISGKDMNRPKLKELLDFVREGGTVIIESYSRLA